MPDSRSRIFHITTRSEAEFAARAGNYESASLKDEGFIHCSYASQLTRVANSLYRGRNDLVLLEIEKTRLPFDVVDEDLYGAQELFPHIYAGIPWPAVVALHEFPPTEDGTFQLPPAVGR